MKFFASFDTLLDPRGAKVVETNFTSKIALFEMIWESFNTVCQGEPELTKDSIFVMKCNKRYVKDVVIVTICLPLKFIIPAFKAF